jgi:HEAT repeat protein
MSPHRLSLHMPIPEPFINQNREATMRRLIFLILFCPAVIPTLASAEPPCGELSRLVSVFKKPGADRRAIGVERLAQLGPRAEAALPALIEALEDEDPMVRYAVAGVLPRLVDRPCPEVVTALLKRMDADPEASVRLAAASALANISQLDPTVIPALIDLLDTPWNPRKSYIHGQAQDALAEIGLPAVPAMIQAMTEPKPLRYRGVMCPNALARIGPAAKDAVPVLIEAMKDKTPGTHEIRKSVANALEAIGPDAKEALPVLIESLNDVEGAVRHRAATAIVAIDPSNEEAVGVLIDALDEPKYGWQVPSAVALARIRPNDPLWLDALLKSAREDPSPWIGLRLAALEGIGRIGPAAKDAVPMLIRSMAHQDEQVRYWSAYALGGIGAAAKSATPVLTQVAEEDESLSVRLMAREALASVNR